MSGTPILSAVARRRATQIEFPPGLDSSQTANKITVDTPSHAITPASSLKRKTSARSLKQPEKSELSGVEGYSRKKLKAPVYLPVTRTFAQEPLAVPSQQRAYSPSQPLLVSSDGEDDITPLNGVELPAPSYDARWNAGYEQAPARAQEELRNMPSLVDGQNYFAITPEQAFSATKQSTAAKVLLLNDDDSILFVGSMRLTLLQGFVRLLGVPLSPSTSSHPVFAPRSHPIPILEVVPRSSRTAKDEQPKTELNTHSLASSLPSNIRQCISTTHTVVVIQELSAGVEDLGRIVQPFANIFEPDPRDANIAELVLNGLYIFKAQSRLDAQFSFPPDWESALQGIVSTTSSNGSDAPDIQTDDAPIILVRGGKNSGKSTFSRTLASCLTNRYRRVAFIECDLGQSEFTPGGMVSLNIITSPILGPPFTHLSQPRHAHFIGGTSPKTSPSHYISALSDLAQHYQLHLRYSTAFDDSTEDPCKDSTVIPLVINTQGWVKGMGADLLRSIEDLFRPTHIVEFQLPRIPSSLDPPPTRPTSVTNSVDHIPGRLIKLLSIVSPPHTPRFSAADLRSLALASYFYGRVASRNSDDANLNGFEPYWDISLPLRSAAPIVVDIHSALESIVITAPGGDDVVAEELSRAIVCGVVGLVEPDSPSAPPATTYLQGALPPSPHNSRCIGLGFVRGASDAQLHLLTPVPVSQLGLCRSVVLGDLPMPIWAFLDPNDDETEDNNLPFLQWGRSVAGSAGGERRRIRRNIMRRGQV